MSKTKNSGLGRGLESLFYDNSEAEDTKSPVSTVHIGDVQPRAGQPRRTFDNASLEELSASIAEHGLIQPIIVRRGHAGYYEIIAGERRWRASKLAGLAEIPAIVIEADDKKTAELSLIENIQREDLNPIEEALAYKGLIEDYSLTQELAALRVSKSRSAVANAMRLLELPDSIVSLVISGKLSAGHARALLGMKDKSKMETVAGIIAEKQLSVRDTERLVKRFNLEDEKQPEAEADKTHTGISINYTEQLEKKIRNRLGRRVIIKNGPRGGRLELEYTGNDDLEALVSLICGKNIFDD